MSHMTVADEILSEASERADLQNGRVIDLAFRRREFACCKCNYPQNAGEFASLLIEHIHLRRRTRMLLIQTDRSVEPRRGTLRSDLFRCQVVDARIRKSLSAIWPCQDCLKKFNPTRRYRRSFRGVGSRFPIERGFLDG